MKVIEINECRQCPYCRRGNGYSLQCRYVGQLYNCDIEMKIIPKYCPLKEQQSQEQYDYHDSQFN